MDILDNEILKDAMRDFINERPHFNCSKIADDITMSRQNFKKWLNDERPLPSNRTEPLEKILKQYGFLQ